MFKGDPIKGVQTFSPNKTQVDHDLDLRDRITELIGKGNALSSDDKRGIYSSLVNTVGGESAMKIMQHAFLFNSRPDMQKLPVEEKIKSFYTIGAHDPVVQGAIDRTRSLGYGVIPGYRTSMSQINQQVAGRVPVNAGLEHPPAIEVPVTGSSVLGQKKKTMFKIKTK